jgi:NADH-quinone oxidoreductase subunit I
VIAGVKGLLITIQWLFRKPVTAHYPEQHLPVQKRYMGFPGLLWDDTADEPFCTGCMVCVRECPTQCMTAVMHDNPKAKEGTSHRRKIIETFEINLNRCILCGICEDVCALDAIEMTHEHELASFARNGARADLQDLLVLGRQFQAAMPWQAKNPEKNVAGIALAKKDAPASTPASDTATPSPKEESSA